MTGWRKRTIMEMAREAGGMLNMLLLGRHDNTIFTTGELERFVDLVREDERNRTWTQQHWTEYERSIAAAEREACAKECIAVHRTGAYFAKLIRARGQE